MPAFRGPRDAPAAPGAYLLHLTLLTALRVVIHRRGPAGPTRPRTFRLPPGEYLYVGSAFGPGGLAARVGRHLDPGAHRRHWDIDFLLAALMERAPFEAWGRATRDAGTECRWAATVARRAGACPVVGVRADGGPSGFGAGDCRRRCGCAPGAPATARTHLFRLPGRLTRAGVARMLGEALVALGRSSTPSGQTGSTHGATSRSSQRAAIPGARHGALDARRTSGRFPDL